MAKGFLRVRAIGDRLYVPDTDPPYNAFGMSETGASLHRGGRRCGCRGPPDAEGYFGAGVLPRAYHVIDVLRFCGALYASTGSVPPLERA